MWETENIRAKEKQKFDSGQRNSHWTCICFKRAIFYLKPLFMKIPSQSTIPGSPTSASFLVFYSRRTPFPRKHSALLQAEPHLPEESRRASRAAFCEHLVCGATGNMQMDHWGDSCTAVDFRGRVSFEWKWRSGGTMWPQTVRSTCKWDACNAIHMEMA